MKRFSVLAALLLVALRATAADPGADFLAARDAFQAGDRARLDGYAKRLQGDVLEPYVGYWQLRLNLDQAGADEVRRYLGAQRGSLLANQLRGDWLRILGKTKRWDLFDAELTQLAGGDSEIACYALQSRLNHGDENGALADARSMWFTPRDLPESCTPLTDALISSGRLTPADMWARMRLALEAGNLDVAKAVGQQLPGKQAVDPRLLDTIAKNPQRYLEKNALDLKNRAGRELAMFAVDRLAGAQPQQAAAFWQKLEARFSRDEGSYVWGRLALHAALQHQPEALSWYDKAGTEGLTGTQLEWKVRAALRAQDWRQVQAAIETLPSSLQDDPAWRYWKARALNEQGRTLQANALLAPLSHEFGYYGILAKEDLAPAMPEVPLASPYRPGAEDIKAVAELPGIKRAFALNALNLQPEAIREWNWETRAFDDKRLLAAAELALRNEWYDRAIRTEERTVALHDFHVRFLAPYHDVIKDYSVQLGLDEAWVYGIVRQESRFAPDAKSSAGASGLMQLMPATARWVARQMGMDGLHNSLINEPRTNISFGTYYLRHLLDLLDGLPVLASAAYNAGPARAERWRDSARPLEGSIYVETIPWNETREYVKRVVSNAMYYARELNQDAQTLKQRLGVISPVSGDVMQGWASEP